MSPVVSRTSDVGFNGEQLSTVEIQGVSHEYFSVAAFQVVALSLDRGGRAAVEPFYKKTGVQNLTVFLDPASDSMKALSLRGLPTTSLVDPEGLGLGPVGGARGNSPGGRTMSECD